MSRKNFTRVKILDTHEKATVIDHLSTQFSVMTESGTYDYYFYKNENITWERLDEERT